MKSTTDWEKRKLLVVEDEERIRGNIIGFLKRYFSDKDILQAENAGQAIAYLSKCSDNKPIDALILDIMISYGDAYEILEGQSDSHEIDTGVRLLEYLLGQEGKKSGLHHYIPTWIAVITARIVPQVVTKIQQLLGNNGRVYTKPYNIMELENDLAIALGLESQVPSVLLSYEYSPPMKRRGKPK